MLLDCWDLERHRCEDDSGVWTELAMNFEAAAEELAVTFWRESAAS